MKNEIESKMNELAQKVVPSFYLQSFKELPLTDKVVGIKFFAAMVNDQEVIKMCEYAEQNI